MNKIYEPFLWLFIDICPLFRHTIHHCSGVSSRLSVCVACYANGARVSRARARSAGARVRTEAAANTGAGGGARETRVRQHIWIQRGTRWQGGQAVKWWNEFFKGQFNCLFCSHTIERNQIRIVKTEPFAFIMTNNLRSLWYEEQIQNSDSVQHN